MGRQHGVSVRFSHDNELRAEEINFGGGFSLTRCRPRPMAVSGSALGESSVFAPATLSPAGPIITRGICGNVVISAAFVGVDMCRHSQRGIGVEGARGDANGFVRAVIKEEARTTVPAKPPSRRLRGGIPGEPFVALEHEIGMRYGRGRKEVPTHAAALPAVTSDDVGQLSRDFERHLTANTAALPSRVSHLSHPSFVLRRRWFMR